MGIASSSAFLSFTSWRASTSAQPVTLLIYAVGVTVAHRLRPDVLPHAVPPFTESGQEKSKRNPGGRRKAAPTLDVEEPVVGVGGAAGLDVG